jgi:UDP-glucose 4-epimerase
MEKYLVTGGCGFIGSHLVDALSGHGHSVRILDDLSTGMAGLCPPGVELIVGNVADSALVAQSMRGVDGCFHLAAVASVERSNTDWLGTHRTNLTGTITVLDAAARARSNHPIPVVFASSAAVYGDPMETPISERTALRPLSAYGADKLGSELHCYIASQVHRVPTCALRFFNVYGPGQSPNSAYSGVISIFCDRLKVGDAITVRGDGQQTRDFVYIGDVVRALLAAMAKCPLSGDVLNVCTGTATTIGGLAMTIGNILRRKPDIVFGRPRKADIRNSVGDPSKAQDVLGFSASVELTTGLALTIAAA